ncbi:MAG: formimidoylglutamase [Phycisphaerales bacterium]|nr:formimidoylglutamase [Phycisphaerales bacterium]
MIPHTAPPVWPDVRPGRFASSISRDPTGRRIALLGLPDEVGVRLNRGRPGAADGPRAFRAALSAFGTTYDGAEGRDLGGVVFDAGNVVPASAPDGRGMLEAMRETHRRVTEAARALHDLGLIVACVGGGHDLTFPAVRALSESVGSPVGGVNIDPHLDVRDPDTEPGSGIPFRALISGGFVDAERFVEFGAGRFANSREHTEWLADRGATVIGIDKALAHGSALRLAFERISRSAAHEPTFVSLDLDAIDSSQAPGVSAPCPMGLSVQEAARIARMAGEHASVRHFDLMELSPPHDDPPPSAAPYGRTARVAAFLFLTFVAGVLERR